MRIGNYVLKNRSVLAPMAGVTDLPFRTLCKNLGAGMAVSEMVNANSLLWGSEKTARRATHEGEPDPRSIQIAGACPKMLAEAAKINADHGAQIIDINMGCPAKKVCNAMAGSALLRDEPLVARILEAVVNAVSIPVTLKIRTGWDVDHKNGVKIAQLAESIGIQALAVHGRTRACAYRGDAEYDTIAAIKAAVNIPVMANGDVTTPEKAKYVLDYTKADAIMIGRAAQGRPWIFREINHYLDTNEKAPEPSIEEIYKILNWHVENVYKFYGEGKGIMIARKHVSWYTKGQRGGGEFRHEFNQLQSADAQRNLTEIFFERLLEFRETQAHHVD